MPSAKKTVQDTAAGPAHTTPPPAKHTEKQHVEKAHEKPGRKAKVVRDSFTMPEVDYARLTELKKRCLLGGVSVKKSELLRAGLQALSAMSAEELVTAVNALESVKTGRPAGEKSTPAAAEPTHATADEALSS